MPGQKSKLEQARLEQAREHWERTRDNVAGRKVDLDGATRAYNGALTEMLTAFDTVVAEMGTVSVANQAEVQGDWDTWREIAERRSVRIQQQADEIESLRRTVDRWRRRYEEWRERARTAEARVAFFELQEQEVNRGIVEREEREAQIAAETPVGHQEATGAEEVVETVEVRRRDVAEILSRHADKLSEIVGRTSTRDMSPLSHAQLQAIAIGLRTLAIELQLGRPYFYGGPTGGVSV